MHFIASKEHAKLAERPAPVGTGHLHQEEASKEWAGVSVPTGQWEGFLGQIRVDQSRPTGTLHVISEPMFPYPEKPCTCFLGRTAAVIFQV